MLQRFRFSRTVFASGLLCARPPPELVAKGILEAKVETQTDSFPLSDARLAEAAREIVRDWKALAPLMTDSPRGVKALRDEYVRTQGYAHVRQAIALGLLGSAVGEDDLIAALAADDFSDGWAYYVGSRDGFKGGRADRYLWALGGCRSAKAVPTLLASVDKIKAHPVYSHFRAYADACERIGDERLLPALASLLAADGVRGHARPTMEPLAYERRGNAAADRQICDTLRELALARAIWRLSHGDVSKPGVALARETLTDYTHDARGVFAAFAKGILK